MRIMHCCLAAFYIDNYGYQENILPKLHKIMGHDTLIVASTETYSEDKTLTYVEPSRYANSDGIDVIRLGYVSYLPLALAKKIRAYKGLFDILTEFKPDLIFLHDSQFFDVYKLKKFLLLNPNVKVVADCHTDLINSGRSFVSKNILHKLIYKKFISDITPFISKFYGVTPLRCDFLSDVYDVPKQKIDLLPLGLDDSEFSPESMREKRLLIRSHLGILETDFVLISGGKLDKRKNIHILIKVLSKIRFSSNKSVKLLLFGQPTPEMKSHIDQLISENSKLVISLGWLTPNKVTEYLAISDLAVFPGTHSTIWEQTVGLGIPAIFKRWEGFEHVDIGGNCLFLDTDDISQMEKLLIDVINNEDSYTSLKAAATSPAAEIFRYSNIAVKSIEVTKV